MRCGSPETLRTGFPARTPSALLPGQGGNTPRSTPARSSADRETPSLTHRHAATNRQSDAFRIPIGVLQAILTVARTRPTVVLSTGGYVSVPIGPAARLFRVPYLPHEQTLGLGLATLIARPVWDPVRPLRSWFLPHRSRTTSVSGRAQQTRTWPPVGGSSGSGS